MCPQVAAHRGGSALAPENTLGAFRAAHERFPGVWLELDARLCSTAELVVIHDHSLERTTSAAGPVAEKTADELRGCDAAAHFDGWGFEPVPALEDVLHEGTHAGWKLLVELKNVPGGPDFDPAGESHVAALATALDRTGFPLERLEVISFWPPTLDRVKALDRGLRVGFLTIPDLPHQPKSGFTALAAAQLCADRGYDIAGPNHRTPDLDPDTVERIHEMGVEVSVWTANAAEDIDRLVRAGVDRITSDRPDLVYDVLNRR